MGQNSQAQTTWETKANNALENMLARELHQNFNGDIVRHASIALKNGGAGTIKIALHPESLGNVKIHLEMTENKITGLIIVESEEALKAFRKEIASLEQAFRDSGFANADLNLSLTQNGQNSQEWERESGSFSSRMAASRYDESSVWDDDAPLVEILIGQKQGSINMLA
jgi:flagellar hook-length control protein FliK